MTWSVRMFSTSVLVLAAMTVGIAAQTPATSTSTSATNTTPPSSSITSSPTSSSTSTGPYTTTISVGLVSRSVLFKIFLCADLIIQNGYQYTPNNVTANPGDVVGNDDFHIPAELSTPLTQRTEFLFFPSNHSVIRAEFGYPCYPYELVHPGSDLGFYSGQEIIQAIQNVNTLIRSSIIESSANFYMSSSPRSRSRSMTPSPSFSTAALPARVSITT